MRRFLFKTFFLLLGFILCASTLSAQVPSNCLAFDGVDDYVNCGAQNPSIFTVEAWAYKTAATTDDAIVSSLQQFSPYTGMEIHFGADLKPSLTVRNSSGWINVISPTPIELNKWYHYAASYDGATAKLYVNGALVGSYATTSYVQGTTNFWLGRRPSGNYYFQGRIDEVRVWNVARTQTQIQQNMNNELSGSESGLLSYYNFNISSGVTLTDIKGSYNGTLNYFALSGSASNWSTSYALAATGISNTGFTANWEAITMATKYRIDVASDAGFNNMLASNIDAGTATNYNFIGLSLNTGTTYYYRLRYESAYGTSTNSLPVSFSPPPGNAIYFDGIDDFIAQPQIATGLTELTIETWINVPVGGQNSNGNGIYNTDAWTNGSPHFQLWANAIQFIVCGATEVYLPYTFTPNTWYHVAGTYNSTTKISSIYINGNLISSSTSSSSIPANLTIGRIGSYANGSPQRFFKGMMDEYRIWSKCKTQAEIQSGMYTSVSGSEANLLRAYNFDQGTASGNNTSIKAAKDASTSAYKSDGTLTNFTLNGASSNFVVSGAMAPIIYEATNVSSTGLTANWKSVSIATKYRIDVSDKADFSSLLASNIDAGTGKSFAISGLTLSKGAAYYYRVRYESTSGISSYSNAKSFILDAGNALALDGLIDNRDYLRVINNGWGMSKVTLEAWVYCNSNVVNTPQFITSKGEGKFEIHIGTAKGNNTIRFIPTTNVWLDAPVNSLLPNKWNHIACSYDPTNSANTKIYINGESISYTNAGANPTSTALVNDNVDFLLGARTGVGYHFDGKIDEFRLWNVIRSQSEIQNNMYSKLSGAETGLLIYYNFDKGVANGNNTGLTTISDLSQNGNSGTLINMALTGFNSNYVPSQVLTYILDATNATTSSFTANWNTVPAATGFLIDVDDASDFASPIILDISVASGNTSYAVSGLTLTVGQKYYYRMRYTTSSGTSDYSEVKSFVASPGNALIFDGTDDYVNMGTVSPTNNFSNGFTYMGWVKWDALQSWARLFDMGIGSNNNNILLATYGTSNFLDFSNRVGTSETYIYTSSVIPTGQWVHIAATINTDGMGFVYMNGEIIGSGNMSLPNNIGRTTCYLGKSNWSDAYFKGSMDEVSFWTRALSQEEINTFKENSLSGSENGLYMYYKFNQGNAGGTNTGITTLTDTKGNQTGTLTNFALTGTSSNFIAGSTAIATIPVPVVYNASNISMSGFVANWKAATGATNYRIDVSDVADFTHLLATNISAGSGTSYTVTGLNLQTGTNYYYRVRYESATGISGNSIIRPFMLSTGNALNFDGSNDHVICPPINPTTFTLEAWVNLSSLGSDRAIVSTLATVGAELHIGTDNKVYVTFYTGSAWKDIGSTVTVTAGTWYHVAATYDGTTAKLYVNGTLENSATTTYSAGTASFNIGRRANGTNPFNGLIDNVAVWNTALSATDIQNTMSTNPKGNESGLLAFYNFDQGIPNGTNTSNSTLYDACSQNYGYNMNFALTGTSSNYVPASNSNNVFYVNALASAGGTGLTPTTAFNNIEEAFAAATGNDTIKVAAGTYFQPAYNVSLVNKGTNLTLLGGYNSSFTVCDPVNNVTVLSGVSGATYSIIEISYCDFTLNGFTLQNGSTILSTNGGALKVNSGGGNYKTKISNCIFQNNKGTGSGAVVVMSGNPGARANFTNCKFYNNTTTSSAGALFSYAQGATLTNCIFDNNSAAGNGGAIYINGGVKDSIFNCTFIRNKANGNASAIDIQGSTAYIANSTFYNNTTLGTGVIHPDNGSVAYLYHNTIVGNTGSTSYCGGVSQYNSTTYLYGNIIVGNVGYNGASDVWNQAGTINDLGFNLFGATDANQASGFTMSTNSQYIKTIDLYNILESSQSASTARLFVANLTNNGGATPTIKVIGRVFKNSGGYFVGNRTVPNTYNITTDQRGVNRLLGNATIGAYESDISQNEKVIYVNSSLSSLGDGRTPATAYNNLQASFACTANDTIKVAAGIYTQPAVGKAFGNNIEIKNLIVYGAYKSDFSTRDTVLYNTTLQANAGSLVPILWILDCNFTIDGFTLKNGIGSSGYEGGAIHFKVTSAAQNYNMNVNNCLFVNNKQLNGNGGAIWAAALNTSSVVNVTNCTFVGNSVTDGCGGSIAAGSATFNISNCAFIKNTATNVGGAIYFDRVTSEIKNNTFFGNTSNTNAGAIWAGDQSAGSASNISLISNTIVGNFNYQTSGAGAIDCARGTMKLTGNIIAGNYSNIGTPLAYDVWQELGTVTDNGYNIFGTNGANNFTPVGSSIIIPNAQLYNILESSNQSNTSARLFPAKVANNGGPTPTIKIIGKYFTDNLSAQKNVRQIPATVSTITMPVKDQRGVTKTIGAACIGAYEMNADEKYIYVDISAPASGSDGTLAHPYNDITLAISNATISDTIKVAMGIYSAPASSFVIDKNLVLMGGFNTAFSQYNPKSFVSIIQFYNGSTPLVKITNTSAELNGFTLQNSQSTVLGGGALVSITDNKAYNIVFKNCIFNANHASNGGGISLDAPLASTVYSNVLVANCTFKANIVTAYGGAISASGRFNTTVINSTFFGNTATINGGAIYQGQDGTLKLQQNTIVGNKCTTTSAGGGVTCTSTGTADLRANIIAGNFSGSAKHDVYKESGTITDNGYNIYGNFGTLGFTKAVSSDSVKTPELYILLKSDTITPTGHAGTYMADRQFYARVESNGGNTPTIKLLKKTFANSASITKNITIVPATVNGNAMAVIDQRDVNRIIGNSCVGSFEYRDTLPSMHIVNDELTSNSAHLHFTPGSFSKRMVFVKNGTLTTEVPANNINFEGDNEFGKGTQIGTSGWYCVYNGNDTIVSVTGLRPVQSYAIKIFEYNDIANYYTDLTKAIGKNNPISIITPKMIQTVGFNIAAQNWGDADVFLPDTTSLGLSNVIYTSMNTAVATIVGNNTIHIVGVGTSLIKANHAGNDTILAASEVSRSFNINADTLFVVASSTNSIYGEKPVFNFTAAGLKNNDSIIANVGVTYTSLAADTSNVGTYDVTPSAAVFGRGVTSNYLIKYVKGTHSITPETVTIKAENATKVYGSVNPAFSYIATGLKNSNTVSVSNFSTLATDISNVGTYDIIPSNATFTNGTASNYNVVYSNGSLTVTPALLTITADNKSRVYKQSNPVLTYTHSNLLFDDALESVDLITSATETSNANVYTIIPSNCIFAKGVASNYTITYTNGTLTVNPQALTIKAADATKLYGSANPIFTFTVAGLLNSDSIGKVDLLSTADEKTTIGSYDIISSNAIFSRGDANNYAIAYGKGILDIQPATITVTAEDKTMPYFSKNIPTYTCTYSGFVNGENSSVLTTYPLASVGVTKSSLPKTYPITYSGAIAANYKFIYVPGKMIVTESPVQICLVSIDLETGKNMVIWERKKGFGIRNYKVYRETATADDYAEIGTLPFAKEGVFVDLTSQPENQQHRYKISAVDSLGNESVMSNYHEPMFLQYNNGVNGINLSWKPYSIEGGTLEFKSYVLYRGADSTKLDSFKTISANATVYIDTDPASLKGLMFYRLGGILKNACNSQSLLKAGGGPFVESVSNLEDNRLRSSGIRMNGLNMELTLFPQPANNVLNVSTMLEKAGNVEFEICNLMGAYIGKVNAGYMNNGMVSYSIDLTNYNLRSGVYIIKLKTNSSIGVKSFIIKN